VSRRFVNHSFTNSGVERRYVVTRDTFRGCARDLPWRSAGTLSGCRTRATGTSPQHAASGPAAAHTIGGEAAGFRFARSPGGSPSQSATWFAARPERLNRFVG
jgi:hypothetical protein